MMDYALWEVIENGATLLKKQDVEGIKTVMPITSVEDKAQRSLSAERNTHVVVWRNKADLDTISMDDLYNNCKVYEPEVKGMSRSNSNVQNMAFLSSTNSSTNRVVNTAQAVNTANGVSTASTQVNIVDHLSDAVICTFLASQSNSPQLAHEDLEQIHPDDIEEIDLRWQMSMLTMRAKRFLKKTRRKLTVNGNESFGFDMFKVECYNCHKRGHFARECTSLRNEYTKHKESTKRSMPVETPASTALVSCDDNCKKELGYESYNAVPPPYTGNFMPPKPDLSYTGLDEFVVKPEVENSHDKSSEEKTNVIRKIFCAPIVEEWVSDDEEENVTQTKIVKKKVRPNIV
nr:hypothetical protein [Tanacetum cinerariifolium]